MTKHRKHPKIVALVSSKGGSGKSSIAACLAAELARRGYKTAMLDTDPQRTLTAWHGRGGPLQQLTIGTANGASVAPALTSLADQHQVVIVDTAGFQNRDTLAVLTHADLALVPFSPTPVDAMGTAQTLALLREVNSTAERAKKPVQIELVMNSTGRGALVAHIKTEVTATGAHLLKTSIGRRVAFAEAFLSGSAPCWMGRGAKPAADEISALADELSF